MGRAILAAVVAALVAAGGFAVSTSLQHRAAGAAPASARTAARLLAYLVTQPLWLCGILAGGVAFGLHAVALNLGAIALVQPIMISGVVFAIFVRAGLDRRRPSGDELRSVTITALGLAVFLVAANPGRSDPPDERTASVLTILGLLAAGVTGVTATRLSRSAASSFLLGAAAGVLFGLTAGLLKFVINDYLTGGVSGVLLAWRVWVLIGAGVFGMAMNQRAYQIAPLSVSMPVLNTVDVLVALLFGLVVFGEVPAHGPLAVVVQVVGLACLVVGLQRIARTQDASAPGSDGTAPDLSSRSSSC